MLGALSRHCPQFSSIHMGPDLHPPCYLVNAKFISSSVNSHMTRHNTTWNVKEAFLI